MIAQTKETVLQNPILQIANDFDADLFLFSCKIHNGSTDDLINEIKKIERRRENVGLVLTTGGGDANAAFRLARFLKRKYNQITLYVFGACKSSGTLIALAADKIVMSDFGELGPLDIQTYKDEDVRRESVLTTQQSINSITQQVSVMFRSCLAEILKMDRDETSGESFGTISLKTAESIASSIVIGLFEPIAAKLDPIRMGKLEGEMQIASSYGSLLNPKMAGNGSLYRLITGYPSHGFVIDYEEAKLLFNCVTTPIGLEEALESYLLEKGFPIYYEDTCIYNLTAVAASPESIEKYTHNGHSPEDSPESNTTEIVEQEMGLS